MAGLLARFTTFIPSTTILSNDHNQELNRLVNLLNGTTTNLKTVLKTSDAGDPPLELDQLSTGPILKAFQGGILKAQISNAGNYLFNQSGGFIGDQNANEYLKFTTTASAINEVTITNAAASGRPKVAASGGDTNIDLELAGQGTGLVRLPASSPTADDHAARKKYVDDKKTAFALSFFSEDPSASAPISLMQFICPDGTAVTLTKGKISYQSGSHTSGGSVEFKFQRRTAAASWADPTDFGSFVLDNTNNTIALVYTNDFSDVSLSAGDTIVVFRNATSGTVTERAVSIVLMGTQQVFS